MTEKESLAKKIGWVIIPKLTRGISRMWLPASVADKLPPVLLVILTVCIPYVLLHLCAWILVTRLWHSRRLHK